MCPPSSFPSAIELNEFSTDETVIKALMQIKSGQTLPDSVLSDVDPYQSTPSNLPPGMWYLWSGSKTDTKNGFWRSTGEACEIYKTSLISGLRKTLQFYQGTTYDSQKTNWIMQEYTTTENYTNKLDPRALYRVFSVDDSCNGNEQQLVKSELVVKNVADVAGPSDVANKPLDQLLDDSVLLRDYLEINDLATPLSRTSSSADLLRDYLEINDLATPLSRTTSSADSSCMTMSMTSEDLFDSDALLCELGDDVVDQDIQDSKVKLNLSAPAKLEKVVMQPTTLGSLNNVEDSKLCTGQTSKTTPIPENKSTSNEVDTSSPLQPSSSSPPPPLQPSSSSPPPPLQPSSSLPPPLASPPPSSSNSSEGSSKDEKKDRANRTKKRKMMKYLCFLAF